jgi:cation:H+ antiporter
MTERIVGLTIVAMGTSLPELITTIIACRKGEGEFALGFIIGSSIFNVMFVLGLAGLVMPLTVDDSVFYDMAVLTLGTLGFYVLARSGKRLVRLEGLLMVLVFLGYMGWLIFA